MSCDDDGDDNGVILVGSGVAMRREFEGHMQQQRQRDIAPVDLLARSGERDVPVEPQRRVVDLSGSFGCDVVRHRRRAV